MTATYYQGLLKELGLNAQESMIYEALLLGGEQRASDLSNRTKLTRTNTYNVLNSLLKKELIHKEDKPRRQLYSAVHPGNLVKLLDEQQAKIESTKKQFNALLKSMVNEYMLGASRPSVVGFEGTDGLQRLYDDLLEDRLPLQSIQDMNKLDRMLSDYNPRFIKERMRRRMKHRLITPESSREFHSSNAAFLRELRYLPDEVFAWDIDLKITEKKVVITTFMSDQIMGIVIIHPEITRSMLSLFEALWAGARVCQD